jgi:hypothetical protein
LDGVLREHWKVTQQNAEEKMPDSTTENAMTKNMSCSPCTTHTKRVNSFLLGVKLWEELHCKVSFESYHLNLFGKCTGWGVDWQVW